MIHLGLQCKDYCALGKNQPSQESEACVAFSVLCALHQEDCELGVSLENPWASDLWRHPVLNSYLDLETQGTPWAVVKSAACQYGMSFPGTDLDLEGRPLRGQPIEKARGWLTNFDLSLLSNQCLEGSADSLSSTAHEH